MRSYARGTKAVLPKHLIARVGETSFCSFIENSILLHFLLWM